MKILVTGGAGFIGSAFVRHVIGTTDDSVVNVDCLTYAGNLDSLAPVADSDRYTFAKVDIRDADALREVFATEQPDAVVHLAAESHVDRSIDGPGDFVQTNVVGTYQLLECARAHHASLPAEQAEQFRFHHVSTDEVYGDLPNDGSLFTEHTPYAPSSPYSATKAASDHLVRAWGRTYGLPVLVTNCSNNYGPYHFPEKLIPHMVLSALDGKPLPVYGDGQQVRDWLFVDDHARALHAVLTRANPGATYNIGGNNEVKNLDVVHAVCDLVDELGPARAGSRRDLVTFVTDRPGHDRRYAIDATRIAEDLGWEPTETFDSGLRKTVAWYLDNRDWWQRVLSAEYRLERKGLR